MISVIVAVYNGAETLQRCIDSVANQTYPHVELIIMDGASTDGSVDILKANDSLIACWESEQDRGIYHAWNKALRYVNGDWVCFLGADDYFWSPCALDQMVPSLIKAVPLYRVVYGQVALVNEDCEVIQFIAEPWRVMKSKIKQVMTGLPHQGVMHHQRLFEEHGIFDETFKIAGDYEFLLRELNNHDALFVSDVILAAMQYGGISAVPENSLHVLEDFRQAHQKVLGGGSGWRWWFAYFKVHVRIFMWRLLGESVTRVLLDLLRRCVGKPKHWTRI